MLHSTDESTTHFMLASISKAVDLLGN